MALAHAILAALYDCPCSGYDLAKRFDGSVGFFWNATHQQIYRELSKLEDRNQIAAQLVEQEHRPDKKIYTLTDTGKEMLKQWIEIPSSISPTKDDLLVKIFAGSIAEPATIVAELEHHRHQHLENLHAYQAIADRYFPDRAQLNKVKKYHYITLLQGIRIETEWLAWCQEAIELLNSIDSW